MEGKKLFQLFPLMTEQLQEDVGLRRSIHHPELIADEFLGPHQPSPLSYRSFSWERKQSRGEAWQKAPSMHSRVTASLAKTLPLLSALSCSQVINQPTARLRLLRPAAILPLQPLREGDTGEDIPVPPRQTYAAPTASRAAPAS